VNVGPSWHAAASKRRTELWQSETTTAPLVALAVRLPVAGPTLLPDPSESRCPADPHGLEPEVSAIAAKIVVRIAVNLLRKEPTLHRFPGIPERTCLLGDADEGKSPRRHRLEPRDT
jgi:hypothetical protein